MSVSHDNEKQFQITCPNVGAVCAAVKPKIHEIRKGISENVSSQPFCGVMLGAEHDAVAEKVAR
jgi:hypothetical protein